MDFNDSPEEEAFRNEVRSFLAEAPKIPLGASREEAALGNLQDSIRWSQELGAKGWLTPAWPKEYGGGGLSLMQQFVLNEEVAVQRVSRPTHLILSLGMAGPTILSHGSKEQKQEFLPPISRGETIWCQGYSEPESGSDLASVQMRAVLDGDDFVLNGQKMFTTFAQYAHWALVLTRTDPDAPKHDGLTLFIVDMKSPGLKVRPLLNMANAHEFNELFFDDVRVPKANVVGEVNGGWIACRASLTYERSSINSAIGHLQMVEALVQYAKEHADDPACTISRDPIVRGELVDRMVEARIGMMLSYNIVSMQNRGVETGHQAATLKLFLTEFETRIIATQAKLLGPYAQLRNGSPWAAMGGNTPSRYMRATAKTIEGGTSEVQRGVIATRGLGLPRSN